MTCSIVPMHGNYTSNPPAARDVQVFSDRLLVVYTALDATEDAEYAEVTAIEAVLAAQ